MHESFDVVIVGGAFSGAATALLLKRRGPALRVLIIEGLAQTAGALCVNNLAGAAEYKPQLVYFMGIDRAKFRKPVLPGDLLHYHVRKVRSRGRAWRFFGEAKVNGQVVAEAEVSAMILDPDDAKV